MKGGAIEDYRQPYIFSAGNDISAIKRKLKRNFFKIYSVLVLLNVYFIYHLFAGANGFGSYQRVSMEKKRKLLTLVSIKEKNQEFQDRIDMLSSANPDLDYLDEIARLELNYSNKDEKVIILKQ